MCVGCVWDVYMYVCGTYMCVHVCYIRVCDVHMCICGIYVYVLNVGGLYMCVVYTCTYVWYIHVCACGSSTQPVPIMWGPKISTEYVPLLFSLGLLP